MKITWPSLRRGSPTTRRKSGNPKTGSKTGPRTGSAESVGSVLPGSINATSVDSVDPSQRGLVDSEWQINLLPYRAVRRKAANRRFLGFLAATAVLGGLIVASAHLVMVERLDVQTYRNDYLSQQISLLEKQIVDIKGLKDEIEATLSRKRAVETLQANRSLAVQILNQLLNPPDGINYKSVKQSGNTLTIDGFAGSNAQVSQFMNQLEHASPLSSPRLVEIHAVQDTSTTPPRKMNEFTLVVDVQDLAKMAEEREQARKAASRGHRGASAPGAASAPSAPTATSTTMGRPASNVPVTAFPAASAVTVPAAALTSQRMDGAQIVVPGPSMASVPVALAPRSASGVLPALPPIAPTASAPTGAAQPH